MGEEGSGPLGERKRESGGIGTLEAGNGGAPGAADAAESEVFEVGLEAVGDEWGELVWEVCPVDSAAVHGGLVLCGWTEII